MVLPLEAATGFQEIGIKHAKKRHQCGYFAAHLSTLAKSNALTYRQASAEYRRWASRGEINYLIANSSAFILMSGSSGDDAVCNGAMPAYRLRAITLRRIVKGHIYPMACAPPR